MTLIHEQRAHEIVSFLAGTLIKGWKAFLVAEQIQFSKKDHKSKISDELSKIIQNSCLETAAIAIANITDTHKDAIHITYLLDYAETNPFAFPLLQKEKTPSKIISDYRKHYDLFKPIFTKIKDQRDQLLAHLDKKLLSDAFLHTNNPVSDSEIKDAFACLHTIIYAFPKYLSYKDDIPSYDKSLNRKIVHDFSILLS